MDIVMPYMHDRKQFGQSIGEFQLMQGKVADMYTMLQAAAPSATRSARTCDRWPSTCARCARTAPA